MKSVLIVFCLSFLTIGCGVKKFTDSDGETYRTYFLRKDHFKKLSKDEQESVRINRMLDGYKVMDSKNLEKLKESDKNIAIVLWYPCSKTNPRLFYLMNEWDSLRNKGYDINPYYINTSYEHEMSEQIRKAYSKSTENIFYLSQEFGKTLYEKDINLFKMMSPEKYMELKDEIGNNSILLLKDSVVLFNIDDLAKEENSLLNVTNLYLNTSSD